MQKNKWKIDTTKDSGFPQDSEVSCVWILGIDDFQMNTKKDGGEKYWALQHAPTFQQEKNPEKIENMGCFPRPWHFGALNKSSLQCHALAEQIYIVKIIWNQLCISSCYPFPISWSIFDSNPIFSRWVIFTTESLLVSQCVGYVAPGGATRDAKEIAGTRPFQSLVRFQRKTVDRFSKNMGCRFIRIINTDTLLGGGFNFCLFSTLFGGDEPILTKTFQMGWTN